MKNYETNHMLKKNIKCILSVIIIFMYIFMFPIIRTNKIIDSTKLIGITCLIYINYNSLFKKKYASSNHSERLYKLLETRRREIKKYSFLIKSFIFLIVVFASRSIIGKTYDFTILKPIINQFITFYFGIYVAKMLLLLNVNKQSIFKILVFVFLVQSSFQLLSFLFPVINTFFNNFRPTSAIIRGQQHYGRIRGLGVSGSAFFGLGLGFGIIYIVYFYYWNNIFKSAFIRWGGLLLLLFGGFSAARSSMLGLIIGIFVLLYRIVKKEYVFVYDKMDKVLLPITVILLFVLYIIVQSRPQLKHQFNVMFYYAFQAFYNLFQKGTLTTSSTSTLFNDMYYPLSTKTMLIGDGFYTTQTGSYYGNTDAGYMRNFLFLGIPGLLMFVRHQYLSLKLIEDTKFSLLIMIFIFIEHIKGETIGFSLLIQSIIFLIVFISNDHKEDNKHDFNSYNDI